MYASRGGVMVVDFAHLKKVHIIGICGTLMGAFATYLKRLGVDVSGSDSHKYPPMSDVLLDASIPVFDGYDPKNLENLSDLDLVVIGNVIRSDNPEALEAKRKGYCITSLPEAMENLFLKQTRNLVVAGTHGKTTTSSLLAYVLKQCHEDPHYFVGGVCYDLPFSFHVSDLAPGKPFVLEGDEYDTSFWDKVPKFNHYLPDDVVLTSVEFDHADIYADFEAVVAAFEGLVSRIRSEGSLIAYWDDPCVQKIAMKSQVPVFSYGIKSGQFLAKNIQFIEKTQKTQFEIWDHQKKVDVICFNLVGTHNVLNALAVWILCQNRKVNLTLMHEAFSSFRGVKRRQEIKAEVGGILVIDDFAHHPTAVRETLKALRFRYPQRRLIAVFEPRSATSRRKVFQKEYVRSFQEADRVFVANPYDQSRIEEEDHFSSELLVQDLSSSVPASLLVSEKKDRVSQILEKCISGDVIVIFSNGSFDGLIPAILECLISRQS